MVGLRRRAIALGIAAVLAAPAAAARLVPVATPAELRAALAAALPGDEIVIQPGDYVFTANLNCDRPGAAGSPIVVRASFPGCARLLMDTVEGFHVTAPWWTFEGLDIAGVCADDSDCEHAFHITGDADHVTVRGSRLHEFNAMIKGNGTDPGTGRVWPDDVLIETTEFFSIRARMTSNPVTPIDVVGGQRWVLRGNFIHDFEKAQGDQVSYAAFLKGNGKDGVIEGNVVACSYATSGGTRVGLSFGGGGSSPDPICEQGTCTPEHRDGILRNNLVVNCSDVGVYLNEAASCQVHGNTLYDTAGIDVRFVASVVDLRDNLLSGRIRTRDGGSMTLGSNLEQVPLASFQAWFADPARFDFRLVGDPAAFVDQGEVVASLSDDFCGRSRGAAGAAPDIGAIEYDGGECDSTTALALLVPPASGPPAGVGNALFAVRAGLDVELSWPAAGGGVGRHFNVYRDLDPAAPGTTLIAPFLARSSLSDAGVVADGAFYCYRVRGAHPCTGAEAE